jgi:RHH-type transcriptional regulator, proline utilization regulon repressor / proline dehydrogenase / delta 1-pyrroline-5-carboxylate dehydrogenase
VSPDPSPPDGQPDIAESPATAQEPAAAADSAVADEAVAAEKSVVAAGPPPLAAPAASPDDFALADDLEPWPERKPLGPAPILPTPETGHDETGDARALAAADITAAGAAAVDKAAPGSAAAEYGAAGQESAGTAAGSATKSLLDLEPRIREIGMGLFRAAFERGPARAASSFVTGRAMQRRILARAMEDDAFRTQLFRFVDVYPSVRDSGDLIRHLRSYLGEVDVPRPLDRLVATDKRRLPSWAVTRLTERGMERMAKSLIAGRDATEALPDLKRLRRRGTGFTLDILGEACLSEAEAKEYARRYHDLLDYLPSRVSRWSEAPEIDDSAYGAVPRVNLSLKVTSLYSQIDPLDFEGSRRALVSALKPLFIKARDSGVFLNLDLERFVHRDLTYAAFADLCRDEELRDYPHLGIVVQAYLRDSAEIVQGLIHLARDRGTPFTVRLVKGAYWDYETILAAQEHWPSPVFLRKAETDAQFERLTKKLVDNWEWTRPALGTHNIRSIAVGVAAAEAARLPSNALEIQVLHGMADSIRRAAVKQGYRVREYVPVGELIPGMAYLVRRLLENTANESFLRLSFAQHQDPESLLAPPAAEPGVSPSATAEVAAPAVAPDEALERGMRHRPFRNEPHTDFTRDGNRTAMSRALAAISMSVGRDYPPLIDGEPASTGEWITSVNPARPSQRVGRVGMTGRTEADRALESARRAFPLWRDTPTADRAEALVAAAAVMRAQRFELAALEVIEAGKPWREADADVAEAIDFLEYYGREILRLSEIRQLSDVPGESDLYFYEPRGVAVVIAPWNFPLAIPTGMVSAALAAGNTVVFKPATPTPILGYALVRILHEAGVPGGVISFLPGSGGEIGDYLVTDPRVDLIAFTGSLETGLAITDKAARVAPGQRNIKRVITELGGKNAIIVDSDADLDSAVEGVLVSAFGYAGQKCSACSRVVVLDTVYDQFLRRLTQGAASLRTGDPADPGTRVGPVISPDARDKILRYIETGRREATLVMPAPGEVSEPGDLEPEAPPVAAEASDERIEPGADTGEMGYFVAPHIFVDVSPDSVLAQDEIFGPVLSVFRAANFDHALEIALGVRYGLTGGLYSRNPAHILRATREFRVGNLYINRAITGAMVGRQPFGGSRMSGVGSKAGGPDYLLQFLEPRVVTENTIRRGFAPAAEPTEAAPAKGA